MFEDFWEGFGIRFGPWGIGVGGWGKGISYNRTDKSHILQIRINPEIKKEEIKVRLKKPGLIEVEWPRELGEEIPIE